MYSTRFRHSTTMRTVAAALTAIFVSAPPLNAFAQLAATQHKERDSVARLLTTSGDEQHALTPIRQRVAVDASAEKPVMPLPVLPSKLEWLSGGNGHDAWDLFDGDATAPLTGHGAQADAGGSSVGNGGAGSLFTGGAGGGTGAVIAGGTPGGGSGNAGARGGGGGGRGHFGGGGGSSADGGGAGPSNGGGGGGGGSWVPKDSLGTFPANGSQPAQATDSDIGDAGAGYGRQGNGSPGRVVVLLPKP